MKKSSQIIHQGKIAPQIKIATPSPMSWVHLWDPHSRRQTKQNKTESPKIYYDLHAYRHTTPHTPQHTHTHFLYSVHFNLGQQNFKVDWSLIALWTLGRPHLCKKEQKPEFLRVKQPFRYDMYICAWCAHGSADVCLSQHVFGELSFPSTVGSDDQT